MDARTACPPTDASAELVVVTVARVDGSAPDVTFDVNLPPRPPRF
jgi:hypothetical protein